MPYHDTRLNSCVYKKGIRALKIKITIMPSTISYATMLQSAQEFYVPNIEEPLDVSQAAH